MADPTTNPPDIPRNPKHALGDGLSAIERAAKIGLGPMSNLGQRTWHGDSKPCVSCGELVRITDNTCRYCNQDLSVEMLIRMQQHSGPWYVLEHVRPFPGVSMERLIRQARRGVVTATTIVRGPHTDHQWRFAAKTPELCKFVGMCWNCQSSATESDTYCHQCAVNLDRPPGEIPESPPIPQTSSELEMLSTAIKSAGPERRTVAQPQQRIPAWIIAGGCMLLAITILLLVIQLRGGSSPAKPETTINAQTTTATENKDMTVESKDSVNDTDDRIDQDEAKTNNDPENTAPQP